MMSDRNKYKMHPAFVYGPPLFVALVITVAMYMQAFVTRHSSDQKTIEENRDTVPSKQTSNNERSPMHKAIESRGKKNQNAEVTVVIGSTFPPPIEVNGNTVTFVGQSDGGIEIIHGQQTQTIRVSENRLAVIGTHNIDVMEFYELSIKYMFIPP